MPLTVSFIAMRPPARTIDGRHNVDRRRGTMTPNPAVNADAPHPASPFPGLAAVR